TIKPPNLPWVILEIKSETTQQLLVISRF
ncbi:unnamed protein product, partial [Acanthoscelides obtectus]